jgi:hypothetical protein
VVGVLLLLLAGVVVVLIHLWGLKASASGPKVCWARARGREGMLTRVPYSTQMMARHMTMLSRPVHGYTVSAQHAHAIAWIPCTTVGAAAGHELQSCACAGCKGCNHD